MGFAGSDRYLASRSLSMAVNAAIVLEKPLLIKGEPGTGKTVLAEAERLIRKAGGHVAAVHSEDKNFAMYEHLGYRITSELFDNGTHGWLVKALN